MSSDIFPTPSDATDRFRTLELTATMSYDAAALGRLMARTAAARRSKAGPNAVKLYDPTGGAGASASDGGWERHTWRIWWAPPSRWREELTWPGGQQIVIVVQPDTALSYVSMHGTLSTSELPAGVASAHAGSRDLTHLPTVADRLREFPLIHPRLPEADWEVTTLGEDVYLGREVRRVRATRRAGAARADESEASGYWPWLDEYEYLVDDALGILLRLTGMTDGVPVAVISADDVRVDRQFPADLFAFVPPSGTRIVHVPRSA